MTAIIEGAEPFLLPGGQHGVLLIHGFTGSPAEMRLLGQRLNEQGYTVLAPRLCGHGTSPEEMSKTNWENWYHSVCDGYYFLQGLCRKVSVAGLSMGGLLALQLSIDYPIKNVISLSAPIEIADERLALLPDLQASAGHFAPKRRRKIAGLPACYSIAYGKIPLPCIHSLLSLIKLVKGNLGKVNKPLLVMQSYNDHTVVPDSAQYIYDRAGSTDKKIVWLKQTGHLVTIDIEREAVFKEITAFLK